MYLYNVASSVWAVQAAKQVQLWSRMSVTSAPLPAKLYKYSVDAVSVRLKIFLVLSVAALMQGLFCVHAEEEVRSQQTPSKA